MIRRALSAWEKRVALFAVSPWSSGALLLFAAAWIGSEAYRGKWIGWDGALTTIAAEVALSTLRAVNRRDIEKDDE
jgi:hypothetical protein